MSCHSDPDNNPGISDDQILEDLSSIGDATSGYANGIVKIGAGAATGGIIGYNVASSGNKVGTAAVSALVGAIGVGVRHHIV